MQGLVFEDAPPVAASAPNRTDIALFVGFAGRRNTPLPPAVATWLREQGWTGSPDARAHVERLQDLPVPIESWDVFDRLFAWDHWPYDWRHALDATYLGAAVRSFFAQGGRKCYVVRVGAAWPVTARRARRLALFARLVPGFPGFLTATPADRASWHGVAHLFGLPDVSFLCLPDLAQLLRDEAVPLPPPAAVRPPAEQFVECSATEPARPADRAIHTFAAPRCDAAGYQTWAQVVRALADLLARYAREVQLVTSIPLPATGGDGAVVPDLPGWLAAGPLADPPAGSLQGLASAFVQLAYPWLRTPGSADLPERLESPDGVLAGILARGALTRGAFRSAAGRPAGDVFAVEPELDRAHLLGPLFDPVRRVAGPSLVERVSVFGTTPHGLALLSDVTASADMSYRPAAVNRLVSLLLRAARRIGEDLVFEPAGERLWAQVRQRLTALLTALLAAGALRGATPAEAFQVRCDRGTMSQNDLDAGRVIAEVTFAPTVPIGSITVVLALSAGSQVSLIGVRADRGVAA